MRILWIAQTCHEQQQIAAAQRRQYLDYKSEIEGEYVFEQERAAQEAYDREQAAGARQRELGRAAKAGKTIGADDRAGEIRLAYQVGKID